MGSRTVVKIFWDAEACRVPLSTTGHSIANAIRSRVNEWGPITSFIAYFGAEEFTVEHRTVRSELQLSGVSLQYCTQATGELRKSKNIGRITVDILDSCIGSAPFVMVIVMRGTTNLFHPLNELQRLGHKVILITTGKLNKETKQLGAERFSWNKCTSGLPLRHAKLGPTAPVPSAPLPHEAFKPLVDCLKAAALEGTRSMSSSEIGFKIHSTPKGRTAIYKSAGVSKLQQYLSIAVEKKIVKEHYMCSLKGASSTRYIYLAPG